MSRATIATRIGWMGMMAIAWLSPATLFGQDASQLIKTTKGSGTLYEKLIVKSSNAYYSKEPTITSEQKPASAFGIYYRLKTDTPGNEKDGYYRIGNKRGQFIGWIKKEDVASWHTRFALEPLSAVEAESRYFTVYADDKKTRPRMKCVGKDEEMPRDAKRLALIVDKPEIESANEVFPVIVFTGNVASSEADGAKRKEQTLLKNLKLEIVFVVDTTPSMEPLIEVAREVTRRTSESLTKMEELKPLVRFGLVEYRDAPPLCEFPARVVIPLTENHDEFRQVLGNLKCSTSDKNDVPEDMVAGLQQAISNDMGWIPNSSKHIIVLGDAPAKDGYDPIIKEEQLGSTRKKLADMISDARPRGGSKNAQLLSAKNFHAVCNNNKPFIEQFLELDEVKKLDEDVRANLKKMVDDPENIKKVRDDPEAAAQGLVDDGMPVERAIMVVKLTMLNEARLQWQKRAQSQMQNLVANQKELQGVYSSIDTYRSKDDSERTIAEMNATLNKAYRDLLAVRHGQEGEARDDAGDKGSISRAIYQLADTSGDAKALDRIETGYATERDDQGRQVARKQVMVFKDELMHLWSTLDSLHTTFAEKADKAERQNVTNILDDLKRAVVRQAAGQKKLSDDTVLSEVIKQDFPLKTPALEVSPKQIAAMTAPAFNSWLESLATARDRAKGLVSGKDARKNWSNLNPEIQPPDPEDEFTFLSLTELP